jgi:hypothetical protein
MPTTYATGTAPGLKTVDLAKRLVGEPYTGVHRRRESNSGLIAAGSIYALGLVVAFLMVALG